MLFACAAVSLRAQQSQSVDLVADKTVGDNNAVTATGRAVLREADMLLTADEIRYEYKTNIASATGHVVYTHGAVRLLADQVVYHRADGTFTAEHIRVGSYPYYISGRAASGTQKEVTVMDARVAYGEPGPWQPTATATKVIVAPGQHLRFEGAQVGIGHAQPIPFPQFQQNLSDPVLSYTTLTGGYRGSLGAYVDAGLHLPVAPGMRVGGDVGYYTARGLMFGPSGTYTDPSDPEKLHGALQSGFINDHGDKGTDVLGRRIPENRAFAEWQHQQLIHDDLSLTAQLNWWKDSEVVRDFRPRLFFPVQQPDTFVEATYENANSFASVFARFEPNSFEEVQQRVPEVRFDLLPTAIGGGIYERFDASIAMLHERPLPSATLATGAVNNVPIVIPDIGVGSPGTTHELRSTRMDAYYGLSRPVAPNDWFTVTPVAGTRVTHYMNTLGAIQEAPYTRVLGEVGADAELRSSGTFDYMNEAWHIDGLRHLFTPKIGYRYIPEADKGRGYIPPIDRQVFSTYLQPLGLGDVRNIDDLHATNTLRLALDNTLQTRDPQYGARDLLTLNVADDLLFKRQPGQRASSEIHAELAAMPTRWLEVGMYNRVSPYTGGIHELNTGITLHDGDAWSVRFANNFLQHQLQDYYIDSETRVNEEYRALARIRYDQRKHRFVEQSYGVVQNLADTWRISYLVSLYSGPRRESHFGFSIQIDTVRF